MKQGSTEDGQPRPWLRIDSSLSRFHSEQKERVTLCGWKGGDCLDNGRAGKRAGVGGAGTTISLDTQPTKHRRRDQVTKQPAREPQCRRPCYAQIQASAHPIKRLSTSESLDLVPHRGFVKRWQGAGRVICPPAPTLRRPNVYSSRGMRLFIGSSTKCQSNAILLDYNRVTAEPTLT